MAVNGLVHGTVIGLEVNRVLRAGAGVLIGWLLAFTVGADLLYLKNGDRLSGTVRYMDGVKLVLATDYASSIAIDWTQIAELHMQRDMTLKLQDGRELQGDFSVNQSGDQLLLDGQPVAGLEQLKDIRQMFAPTPKTFTPTWRGRVELAAEVESGSSETEEYQGKLDVSYSAGRNRHSVELATEQERNQGERTKDRVRFVYQFDHFFDQHWYSASNYQYNRNKFKSLQRRNAIAQSVGYSFFENPVERFYIESGLSYTEERYDSGTEIDDPGFRWALGYRRQSPMEWLSFYHTQRILMPRFSSTNASYYTDTGFEFDLFDGSYLKLAHEWDYDRRPEEGEDRRDSVVRFGAGYRW